MILLIEDRAERQKHFMVETNIDLYAYSDILDNMSKEKYQNFLQDIETDTFDLDKYTVIMSHKSAFGNDNINILQKLEKHCKLHQKPLILFSGGIDTNYYENIDFEFLELNSKLFYSENLKLFLDETNEGIPNILTLAYGKQWKLNILLNVLEKINLEIEQNEKMSHKTFQLEVMYHLLEGLDMELYSPIIDNKIIAKDEMKKIALDLEKFIEKEIIYA